MGLCVQTSNINLMPVQVLGTTELLQKMSKSSTSRYWTIEPFFLKITIKTLAVCGRHIESEVFYLPVGFLVISLT